MGQAGSRDSFLPEIVAIGLFFLVLLLGLVGLGHSVGTVVFHWRSLRLKAFVPLGVYVVLVPLVLVGYQRLALAWSPHLEAILIENFYQHEAELQELASMFTQDTDVLWLCPSGSGLWKNAAAKPSPERLARYNALFDAAGIKFGVSRYFRGEIWLRYWAVSGATNIEKGYAYLTTPPEPLVESLDQRSGRLAYRHLTGSWYLYYYDGDSISGPCTLPPTPWPRSSTYPR